MSKQFKYSVLRYQPSQELEESMNIGLLLQFIEDKRNIFLKIENWKRIKVAFPDADFNTIEQYLKDFDTITQSLNGHVLSAELLAEKYIRPDSNALSFSEIRIGTYSKVEPIVQYFQKTYFDKTESTFVDTLENSLTFEQTLKAITPIKIERNQLQSKTSELEGGAFESLCNDIIQAKYGLKIMPNNKVATNKPTIGTPDAWSFENGNFAFIEITTQEAGTVTKFKKDIDKCFDEVKTKIKKEKIKTIILGANIRLKANEILELYKHCSSYKKDCLFIPLFLDDIVALLRTDLAFLAKQHLDIKFDTNQFLTIEEFEKSDRNNSITKLENKFIGRDKELKVLTNILSNTEAIVLEGKAGLGKSKIAVEILKQFDKENPEYTTYCISDNRMSLYEDLQTYIVKGGKYALLIDDANRVNSLSYIFEALQQKDIEAKLILTVRDYAVGEVLHKLKVQEISYQRHEVNELSDEHIKTILEELKVNHPNCVNRILPIANGNPRLAMMAAEYALEENNCYRLENVSQVYDNFFSNYFIDKNALNFNSLKVLGVISFFREIYIGNDDFLKALEIFEIQPAVFAENLEILHNLELVYRYDNDKKLIKIANQTIGEYFFYKVFIKDQLLNIGDLLINFFNDYPQKVRENIQSTYSNFDGEKVKIILHPHLKIIHNQFEKDENRDGLFQFFKEFPFYNLEAAILFIYEQVANLEKEEETQEEENEFGFWFNPQKTIKYQLLELIEQYINYLRFNRIKLSDVYEIALNFLDKIPSKRKDFINFLRQNIYTFTPTDFANNLEAHKVLLGNIFDRKAKKDKKFAQLFWELAPHFVSCRFQSFTSGRGNEFYSHYGDLSYESKDICHVRKFALDIACNLAKQYPEDFAKFINTYVPLTNDSKNEILKKELGIISTTIEETLDTNNLLHIYYVHHFWERYTLKDIESEHKQDLLFKFNNEQYELASKLHFNLIYERYNDGRRVLKGRKYHTERLTTEINAFKSYDLADYKILFDNLSEIIKLPNVHNTNVPLPIVQELIFKQLIGKEKELVKSVIDYLFQKGNLTHVFLSPNLTHDLIEKIGFELLKLIDKYEFNWKDTWRMNFYKYIPERLISNKLIDTFYNEIEQINDQYWLNTNSNWIKKYSKFETDFYQNILKSIIKKYETQRIYTVLNRFDLFENDFEYLSENIDLLIAIYEYMFESEKHYTSGFYRFDDYDNEYLLKILAVKPNYINNFLNSTDNIQKRDTNLSFIWQLDNAETLIDNLFEDKNNTLYGLFLPDSIKSIFRFKEVEVGNRIVIFINGFIKRNSNDKRKIRFIFSIIKKYFPNLYQEYIIQFIKAYPAFEKLEYIDFISSSYIGSSEGQIPFKKRRIELLENLKNNLTGISFIEHRAFFQERIEWIKDDIDRLERENFIRDYN